MNNQEMCDFLKKEGYPTCNLYIELLEKFEKQLNSGGKK